MMNEQTIREQFLKIVPVLTAWGQYVQTYLSQLTHEILQSSNHIQIDATYRVKDIGSYCDKAICRYPSENPIKDITDKVGARIVLLNKEDVKIVTERIADESKNWECLQKTRDTEKNIFEHPEVFSYASEHFIVCPTEDYDTKGVDRKILTCEIQVRTLLQHVYAEVSHDTVYKKKVHDEPQIRRMLASTMAFIEESDNKILQVYQKVADMNTIDIQIQDKLISKYQEFVPSFMPINYDERLSLLFLNIFEVEDLEDFISYSDVFFDKYQEFISCSLNKYHQNYFLFAQPIILLCFYEIKKKQQTTLDKWPYGYESLKLVLKSMNITPDILYE